MSVGQGLPFLALWGFPKSADCREHFGFSILFSGAILRARRSSSPVIGLDGRPSRSQNPVLSVSLAEVSGF
jgi:hypothetical protein